MKSRSLLISKKNVEINFQLLTSSFKTFLDVFVIQKWPNIRLDTIWNIMKNSTSTQFRHMTSINLLKYSFTTDFL